TASTRPQSPASTRSSGRWSGCPATTTGPTAGAATGSNDNYPYHDTDPFPRSDAAIAAQQAEDVRRPQHALGECDDRPERPEPVRVRAAHRRGERGLRSEATGDGRASGRHLLKLASWAESCSRTSVRPRAPR